MEYIMEYYTPKQREHFIFDYLARKFQAELIFN